MELSFPAITWDQKFLDASAFKLSMSDKFALRTSALEAVADNFYTNFARAQIPGTVIPDVSYLTAMRHLTVSLLRDQCDLPTSRVPNEPDKAEFDAEVQRRFDLLASARSHISEEIRGPVSLISDTWFKKEFENNPHIKRGLDALLSSMVLNGWTAFETVAVDLWESAINENPAVLGKAALTNTHKMPSGDRSQKPVITYVHELIEHRRDFPVGLMVRETERFNFNRLDGIRAAYETTFGTGAESVFKDSSFEDLVVLEGVRNVLVHRAGRIDRDYLKRVSKNATQYARLGFTFASEGENIQLNGEVVNSLLEAVYVFTAKLFHCVDDWLTAHPL